MFESGVFCISLKRHGDRWRSLDKRLRRWGLAAERINAVDGWALAVADAAANAAPLGVRRPGPALSPGERGCLASHRLAIQTARERGMGRVLVFEDDACLHRRFGERLAELAAIGDAWDLLYLGSSQYDRRTLRFVNAHCYRARQTLGTFAYAMRHTLFDKFLSQTAPRDLAVDAAMTRLQDDAALTCLVWRPPLVIADVRQSDIRPARDLARHAARMGWRPADYDVPELSPRGAARFQQEELKMDGDRFNGFPECRFLLSDGAEAVARCAHPRVRAAKGLVTRETCGSCALREAQSGLDESQSVTAMPATGRPGALSTRAFREAARGSPSERASVMLAIDRFGWAFHADANGLVKHLSGEFDLNIVRYRELMTGGEAARPRPVECDLLVAFWWQSLLGIDTSHAGAVACGLFETWSWDVHGPEKLQAALDKADVLLLANEYILDDLRDHPAEFRTPAVFLCEEGVDCDLFQPQPFPDVFRVGWAGTTVNAKGFRGERDGKGLAIVEEAARLADVRLLAAKREDDPRSRATARQIGHELMAEQYYRHISAHCVGSYSEGAPLTAAEALACGRPVIATNVGTVPRLMQNGVNGLIVPRDAMSLAAAMREIERLGPETMAAAARRSALLFDWGRLAPRWAHAFRSALELRRRKTHARIAPRPEYASGEWEVRRFGLTGEPPRSPA